MCRNFWGFGPSFFFPLFTHFDWLRLDFRAIFSEPFKLSHDFGMSGQLGVSYFSFSQTLGTTFGWVLAWYEHEWAGFFWMAWPSGEEGLKAISLSPPYMPMGKLSNGRDTNLNCWQCNEKPSGKPPKFLPRLFLSSPIQIAALVSHNWLRTNAVRGWVVLDYHLPHPNCS